MGLLQDVSSVHLVERLARLPESPVLLDAKKCRCSDLKFAGATWRQKEIEALLRNLTSSLLGSPCALPQPFDSREATRSGPHTETA